jgi:hypothetical protein
MDTIEEWRERMEQVSRWEDPDEGRAPICPFCGVTALPAELSNVIDSGFVCENEDCDGFGEPVASSNDRRPRRPL